MAAIQRFEGRFMNSEYEAKQGLPPVKEVIGLLNAAYGDWGDEKQHFWYGSSKTTHTVSWK